MNRLTTRCAPVLLLLVFFIHPISSICSAGSVPSSAYSHGQITQPEFLDHVNLVFQFPGRAADSRAEIFTANRSAGSYYGETSYGLGLIGRVGSHGLFLLAQDKPEYYHGGSVIFQGGWGMSWNALRFGLALRGSRKNDDDHRLEYEILYPDDELRSTYDKRKMVEGSAGFGIHSDRIDVDIAFELLDQERTIRLIEQDTGDTLETGVVDAGDPSPGIAGRLVFRAGGGKECVVVGGWASTERDLEELNPQGTITTDMISSTEPEKWFCGMALLFPTSTVDRIRLSSMFRTTESISFDSDYRSAIRGDERINRQLSIAAALEHELYPSLLFRAGVGGYYEKRERSYHYDNGTVGRVEVDREENLRKGFAWGATWRWREIELTGSASTTLSLDYPFLYLDARLFL